MSNPFAHTESILRSAAKLAVKEGLKLEFRWTDLGDLYHVYGVNATGARLFAMLKRRAAAAGPTSSSGGAVPIQAP